MSKKKVLILSNPLNHEGGIVNYYNLFFKFFKSDEFDLKHMSIGSRAYLFYYPILKRILYPFYFVFDVVKFIGLLFFDRKIRIIQFSPSLIPVPLIRDGILVVLSKLFRKKIIVFYRGWKLPVYNIIAGSTHLKKLFNYVFQKSTYQIVLANSFKEQLIQLNPQKTPLIDVTTTAIEVEKIIPSYKKQNSKIEVLFLARIQNLKGIYELISAIIKLKENNELEKFKFTIAGHEARKGLIAELHGKLKSMGITEPEVDFVGRLDGQDKFKAYSDAEIYVLPSYTEGCPNSVLEALSSGLYCITTNVGALKDLIVDYKNGKLIKSRSSNALYNALIDYSARRDELIKLSFAGESKRKFDIRSIAEVFRLKYIEICNG